MRPLVLTCKGLAVGLFFMLASFQAATVPASAAELADFIQPDAFERFNGRLTTLNDDYFSGRIDFLQRQTLASELLATYSADDNNGSRRGFLTGWMFMDVERRLSGLFLKLLYKKGQRQAWSEDEKRIMRDIATLGGGEDNNSEKYFEQLAGELPYLAERGIKLTDAGWQFEITAKIKLKDRNADSRLDQALHLLLPPLVMQQLDDPERREIAAIGDYVILPENADIPNYIAALPFQEWQRKVQERTEAYYLQLRMQYEHNEKLSNPFLYWVKDAWRKHEQLADKMHSTELAIYGYLDRIGVARPLLLKLLADSSVVGERARQNIDSAINDLETIRNGIIAAPIVVGIVLAAAPFYPAVATVGLVCLGTATTISIGKAVIESSHGTNTFLDSFLRHWVVDWNRTMTLTPVAMLLPIATAGAGSGVALLSRGAVTAQSATHATNLIVAGGATAFLLQDGVREAIAAHDTFALAKRIPNSRMQTELQVSAWNNVLNSFADAVMAFAIGAKITTTLTAKAPPKTELPVRPTQMSDDEIYRALGMDGTPPPASPAFDRAAANASRYDPVGDFYRSFRGNTGGWSPSNGGSPDGGLAVASRAPSTGVGSSPAPHSPVNTGLATPSARLGLIPQAGLIQALPHQQQNEIVASPAPDPAEIARQLQQERERQDRMNYDNLCADLGEAFSAKYPDYASWEAAGKPQPKGGTGALAPSSLDLWAHWQRLIAWWNDLATTAKRLPSGEHFTTVDSYPGDFGGLILVTSPLPQAVSPFYRKGESFELGTVLDFVRYAPEAAARYGLSIDEQNRLHHPDLRELNSRLDALEGTPYASAIRYYRSPSGEVPKPYFNWRLANFEMPYTEMGGYHLHDLTAHWAYMVMPQPIWTVFGGELQVLLTITTDPILMTNRKLQAAVRRAQHHLTYNFDVQTAFISSDLADWVAGKSEHTTIEALREKLAVYIRSIYAQPSLMLGVELLGGNPRIAFENPRELIAAIQALRTEYNFTDDEIEALQAILDTTPETTLPATSLPALINEMLFKIGATTTPTVVTEQPSPIRRGRELEVISELPGTHGGKTLVARRLSSKLSDTFETGMLWRAAKKLPALCARFGISIDSEGKLHYPDRAELNGILHALRNTPDETGLFYWSNPAGEVAPLLVAMHLARGETIYTESGSEHFHELSVHFGSLLFDEGLRNYLVGIARLLTDLRFNPTLMQNIRLRGVVTESLRLFAKRMDDLTDFVGITLIDYHGTPILRDKLIEVLTLRTALFALRNADPNFLVPSRNLLSGVDGINELLDNNALELTWSQRRELRRLLDYSSDARYTADDVAVTADHILRLAGITTAQPPTPEIIPEAVPQTAPQTVTTNAGAASTAVQSAPPATEPSKFLEVYRSYLNDKGDRILVARMQDGSPITRFNSFSPNMPTGMPQELGSLPAAVQRYPAYFARLGIRLINGELHYPDRPALNRRIIALNGTDASVAINLFQNVNQTDVMTLARQLATLAVPYTDGGGFWHFHDLFAHWSYLVMDNAVMLTVSSQMRFLLALLDDPILQKNATLSAAVRAHIASYLFRLDAETADIIGPRLTRWEDQPYFMSASNQDLLETIRKAIARMCFHHFVFDDPTAIPNGRHTITYASAYELGRKMLRIPSLNLTSDQSQALQRLLQTASRAQMTQEGSEAAVRRMLTKLGAVIPSDANDSANLGVRAAMAAANITTPPNAPQAANATGTTMAPSSDLALARRFIDAKDWDRAIKTFPTEPWRLYLKSGNAGGHYSDEEWAYFKQAAQLIRNTAFDGAPLNVDLILRLNSILLHGKNTSAGIVRDVLPVYISINIFEVSRVFAPGTVKYINPDGLDLRIAGLTPFENTAQNERYMAMLGQISVVAMALQTAQAQGRTDEVAQIRQQLEQLQRRFEDEMLGVAPFEDEDAAQGLVRWQIFPVIGTEEIVAQLEQIIHWYEQEAARIRKTYQPGTAEYRDAVMTLAVKLKRYIDITHPSVDGSGRTSNFIADLVYLQFNVTPPRYVDYTYPVGSECRNPTYMPLAQAIEMARRGFQP